MIGIAAFRNIVLVDVRLHCPAGERPTPVVMVLATSAGTERVVIRQQDCQQAWYAAVGSEDLVVCLDGEALVKCLCIWQLRPPRHIIDLGVEARMRLNGTVPSSIADQMLVLARFGVARAPLVQQVLPDRLLRSDRLAPEHEPLVAAYTNTRLDCLQDLWAAMPDLDVPRALLRGRSLVSVAKMGLLGLPIDVVTLSAMDEHHGALLRAAVEDSPIAPDGSRFYFFNHQVVHFRESALRRIANRDADWPRNDDDQVSLDNRTLDIVVAYHPELRGLADARRRIDGLGYRALPVGTDGRHRYAQRPFASSTGRSQPLGREALAMQAKWRRHLVVPGPGRALIVADFAGEELGIVAALSGDLLLQEVYQAHDAYIRMAQIFGVAPANATKATHGKVRAIFKVVTLVPKIANSLRVPKANRLAA